jgi:hypothetical protein
MIPERVRRNSKLGTAPILPRLHFSSGRRVGLLGMTLAVTLASWLTLVVCLSNLIKIEVERLVA